MSKQKLLRASNRKVDSGCVSMPEKKRIYATLLTAVGCFAGWSSNAF